MGNQILSCRAGAQPAPGCTSLHAGMVVPPALYCIAQHREAHAVFLPLAQVSLPSSFPSPAFGEVQTQPLLQQLPPGTCQDLSAPDRLAHPGGRVTVYLTVELLFPSRGAE